MGDTDLQYLSVVVPAAAAATADMSAAADLLRAFNRDTTAGPVASRCSCCRMAAVPPPAPLFRRRRCGCCSGPPKADADSRRLPPTATALAIAPLAPCDDAPRWCCCCSGCWCRLDTRKLLKFTNRPGCVRWYCDLVRVRLLPATSATHDASDNISQVPCVNIAFRGTRHLSVTVFPSGPSLPNVTAP